MATTAGEPAAQERRVTGVARLGRRTKHLVKRLRPGEIAIIDHEDLDRVMGEDLAACGVAAVLNCRPSSSGTYPNMGPLLLVQAGIHLVDLAGDEIFERIRDGDGLEVAGGEVRRRGEVVATGTVQSPADVLASHARQREDIGHALEAFARNTVEYMVAEQELLSGRLDLPRFDTRIADRHALVVVRGVDHKRDLRALRPYVRDVRPAIIAVDGGADAVLEEGFVPDMIVGDMDSASERALRSGAELVVHGYPDGRAPGREHLEELGLPYKVVLAPATSQDIAMLIAAERGARLIVTVGSQFNLLEFLDKNRKGMSSTFITRLRIGEILVDAKGVSRLYRPVPGAMPLLGVLAAGLVAFGAVVALTPGLREVAGLLWLKLQLLAGIGP